MSDKQNLPISLQKPAFNFKFGAFRRHGTRMGRLIATNNNQNNYSILLGRHHIIR